jgi:NAD-dependent dihydropyrimidine dehydrogenase PreA subunit
MTVKIDKLKCTGCGACTLECPVSVLYIEDMKCQVAEGCIDCGACIERCQWRAITPEENPAEKKK